MVIETYNFIFHSCTTYSTIGCFLIYRYEIKEIYDDLKVYSVVYNPVGGIDRKYS
jgi:hypothetical protein